MQTLTKTYTGAQTIIQTLKNLGVDTIFGYPGGIVLGVYDELAKQNDIKHYLVRHEQAAVHAAEGYARVSGKCGVVLVTSGPGATNVITGLANASLDGSPLVVITGQVSAELLHKDAFQEVDIIDMTKSCAKRNFQVTSAETLQETLVKAFSTAMTGKKGPVVVDITKNVFSETCELIEMPLSDYSVQSDFANIDRALNAICTAKRPLILTGGGAINASEEIFKLAKTFNIPVVSTMMGLGFYPASDRNYLGMIGIFGSANKAVMESDLVFAVGVRFNDRIANFFKNCNLIHLDINENAISNIVPASIGLVGDAKEILTEMLCRNYKAQNFTNWCEYANTLVCLNPKKRSNKMHSFEVMQEIAKYAGNFVITTEVGQHQVWAARYLKFDSPRKFITSGGLGTMGFGFPAAIGASIANNAPVICISGDGSLQMNIQELATCVDYNLPVKVFIFNNGYLGMVRQFQEKTCEERYFAAKISNPDFVKLAESYGALGLRVESIEQIKPAIEKAFAFNGPVLVDFIIEPMEIL